MQLELFYQRLNYKNVIEDFYFHYTMYLKPYKDVVMPIYTGKQVGNTISLDTILKILEGEKR